MLAKNSLETQNVDAVVTDVANIKKKHLILIILNMYLIKPSLL